MLWEVCRGAEDIECQSIIQEHLHGRTKESTVNGGMIYYVMRLENAGDALKDIVPKGFPGMCVTDIGGLQVMGKTALRFHGQDSSTPGEYRASLFCRS